MAAEDGPTASTLEMAVMEANALALGLSVDTLMENAGRAVAEEVATHLLSPPAQIVVLAGTGNNGGDGTCAAFYLSQWGNSPEVWLVRPPSEIRGASARRCWERVYGRCPTHVGPPRPEDLRGSAVIVDALLGLGQHGPPRGAYADAILAANAAGVPILSVDVPSGLGFPHAIRPRWTVTLSLRKDGMNEDNAGDIRVRDIGIPADARLRTGPGEFLRAPHRSAASGARSGRVLVVAGGPFTGAPVFAGLAALRSGAERATLVVPSPAAESARAGHPDLVVHTVGHDVFTPADVPRVEEIVRKFPIQSMVIGMGVGREPDTLEAMRTLVGSFRGRIPMVVDADALASLTATPGASSSLVATPNTGEYLRWFGDEGDERPEDRLELARRHALDWGVTLLAKGPADLITDGREGALNLHHHPAATVAGVGDVLGGVVGGLLAQGVPAFGAARLAAYWVGDAGSHVAEARGYGLTASDVLSELPATLVAGLRRLDGYA